MRRFPSIHLLAWAGLLLLALAPSALSQSSRVQVTAADVGTAAALLESEGFVIEHVDPEGRWLEIILSDSDLPRLESYGYPFEVLEHSRPLYQLLIEEALDPNFYTWGELNQEMLNWQNAYPALAQRVDLTALSGAPATHEGRHIYGLKISDNVAADEDEVNVLFVANHHAREISTPVAMVELMDHLLTQYGVDPLVTKWVDENEIWIVPTWNPDGLEYVWNVDQWWRKNRRNNGGGIYGVDLNRNYPFRWAYCGSYSHSPSSETYVGPSPASEPETQTMLGFARGRRFAKVIDCHTSGREVLYPYVCMSMPGVIQAKVDELRSELAAAASYSYRKPSASGEHFEWEFNEIGAISYLFELDTTFFPTWSQALIEYNRVEPAFRAMLNKPIPLRGNVYDAWSGVPLADAAIAASGVNWSEGEKRQSGPFGRYHYWIDEGAYSFTFSRTGYFASSFSQTLPVAGVERQVFLNPVDRPYLELEGTAQVGQLVRFRIENAGAYPSHTFTVWLSRSGGGPFVPGIPISGGLTVPLVQDLLTTWGMSHGNLLQGTIGAASGTGTTPWATVPGKARGWTVWAAAVVSQGGVNLTVTPAMQFNVQ